jgi:hypothetical protein
MRIENLLATHQHPVVVSSNGVVLVRTPSALHVHVRLLWCHESNPIDVKGHFTSTRLDTTER